MADKPPARQVAEYVKHIKAGRIPACKWLQRAVERYDRDRRDAGGLGFAFDQKAAERVASFFPRFLKHSKGEWAGQPFRLEPWELFMIWNLFGWKRKSDGFRRFRTAYIEVARKAGKSTLLAGIGLYLLVADNEPGAEIYTAATMRDQARITHSEATRMVQMSAALRSKVAIFKNNLSVASTASKYVPLGADADTLDGLNVHGAIVDELHAHKTQNMWDVLDTGTAARRQPLQIAITTAGYDRESICWELHDYLEKILDSVIQDETFFGVIYTLDPDDDWKDEKVWIKANPNLGVSVKIDDLRRKATRVAELPSSLNAYLRLHMNLWTQSETRWIPAEAWAACGGVVDAEALRGRRCFGGLDLSSTTDVTAWVICFPPEVEGERFKFLFRFFVPQENVARRVRRDRVPYDVWIRQGFVVATPGNVVDYHYVIEQIRQDALAYDIHEVAFDRWGAAKIMTELQNDGLTVVPFGQGFASMSPPSKEFEKLVVSHGLEHGGNPVMAWMVSNAMARRDPADNIKPDKGRSTDRIDGVVAAIMALDRAERNIEFESVYETRGILVF
jgi:phage terminase large subunit-like protein